MGTRAVPLAISALLALGGTGVAATDDGLVGHWRLAGDCRDSSGHGNHGVNHGAQLGRDAAVFDGIDDWVEVPASPSLRFGTKPFSIAVWVHTEADLDDVLGDILSHYDPATRTGVNLCIQNFAGVTSAQSNYRNLFFGIDADRVDPRWTDCGRPGNAVLVFALAVFEGKLYAATCEPGKGEAGHVYRYDPPSRGRRSPATAGEGGGEKRWTPCGRLGSEKEVMAMAVYNGRLYAGTLPLAQVYRYDGGTTWTSTGQLDATPDVKYRRAWSMAVYDGKLFAGTLPSGHVLSLEAGKCVTYDRALAPGWRHVVAVKAAGRLELYVDGKRVATSSGFKAGDYDLVHGEPLRIGFGQHDHLNGKLRDLRIYNRALAEADIRTLCNQH